MLKYLGAGDAISATVLPIDRAGGKKEYFEFRCPGMFVGDSRPCQITNEGRWEPTKVIVAVVTTSNFSELEILPQ